MCHMAALPCRLAFGGLTAEAGLRLAQLGCAAEPARTRAAPNR
jgi:hypothetical protein